ncbi:transposase [Trichonephila clavipes]|nr:transposase [Trichonephila clavipes]
MCCTPYVATIVAGVLCLFQGFTSLFWNVPLIIGLTVNKTEILSLTPINVYELDNPFVTYGVVLLLSIVNLQLLIFSCLLLKANINLRTDWMSSWLILMLVKSLLNVIFGIYFIYEYGFGLAIHQNDHQSRRRFVEWAQNEIAIVPDFHKRILFSDEAHFWLNGYVNKQNCRIWSEANPQVYVETPLHPEKLTVCCALWAGGILLQNDEGHNVTVNGDRYRAMITNFFIPELNNHDVQELWFQQDGATCHTARATIDLLKDTFGGRLISRFGPVNWPPRSCDLTPLNYFLWG